ncbi:aryl-alcohol dehydrogenase [Dentipellis sp. KUC8613]|nr:aryl-alcohol dehydrogenase [Dentipellis sp. KUC8613]
MSESTKRVMPYVRLGKSGLKVSRIILGCMSYGSSSWQDWVLDEEEGMKHIKAAYDLGIQTFDTANVYSNGYSEIVLGKAIKKYSLPRDEIVVMTKHWFTVAHSATENLYGKNVDEYGYVNQHGSSRKHIFDAVKHSLERLQLDYIDVLQCHRFDGETPIEETMHALHDVVQAGLVRYIGMSSCDAWQFHVMQNYALTHNLTPFISMQNHYNLLYREEEREMMPTLRHFGVGAIPWSPLARGNLTRPFGEATVRAGSDPWAAGYGTPFTKAVIDRVEELARKHSASMAQIALAWVLTKDAVSAPIVGTTSLAKLADIVGALDVQLTPDEVAYLEAKYEPRAVFGHSSQGGI